MEADWNSTAEEFTTVWFDFGTAQSILRSNAEFTPSDLIKQLAEVGVSHLPHLDPRYP